MAIEFLDDEQVKKCRRFATEAEPSPMRTYARCYLAMLRKQGARLSAEDVIHLFRDDAIREALRNATEPE